ncbi:MULTISPECIES: HlyD family efflux transporter periplasmic adaptor subunit [Isoptericola]|uniref:HlyD family secretion protein n=1 Tax=Isoptericola sediminis TaxID=2733572 RepID=A0A849JS67_9MICO|nr:MULTISPECIES: HlyD family secretion protein [Isoptericola]MDO8145610.1 HlyD family secretion protein [Isoptericola sp. 178]MDO8149194.1 HlyD family secretion protein [Isoptericola sp. b515]MDO8152133.1 HlyD family secretion protein [Isoptericola sp. b408]NNU26152.1 HlyD family secretion protein [Isoptericola sediminis]
MTWATRFKLLLGFVLVLALCATLTLVLNRRESQATSAQAMIVAEEVAVGTDYPGTVVESFVDPGDTVAEGDPIYRMRSLVLAHDLSSGTVSRETASYEVTDDGEMTVVAPSDGTIADITTTRGGFVQAGDVVATLHREGSTAVDAKLLLDPADFARIKPGAPVSITLPDQREVTGQVDSIAVDNARNRAEATLLIDSESLTEQAGEGLVLPGTPVVASVQLHDEGPMADVDLAFQRFLQRIGL